MSPSACTHATLAHGILNVIIQSVDRSELVQFVPLLPLIQVFDASPPNDTTDVQILWHHGNACKLNTTCNQVVSSSKC